MAKTFTVEQSLQAQAASCSGIGSPLYGTLLTGLLHDYQSGGVTAGLLDGVTDKPVHDALPLRYVAAGHLLALRGDAPALARHYPSCGGEWDGSDAVVHDFLAAVTTHHAEFARGVHRNVQTNEVGRAPVLASGFAWIAHEHGLPVALLEIGSSAGLLSRWDRYGYDTGTQRIGDPASPLQFGPEWWKVAPPPLGGAPHVVRRHGSDISPIDISTEDGRLRMVSFLWPDQTARVERLRAALAIAQQVPVPIETADAGVWLAGQLADGLVDGVATVVFHSIVWQYLPDATKDAVRTALAAAGARATARRPLCWLRMEPFDATVADLRVTTWPGATERRLAEVGYHGADIRWLDPA